MSIQNTKPQIIFVESCDGEVVRITKDELMQLCDRFYAAGVNDQHSWTITYPQTNNPWTTAKDIEITCGTGGKE